MKSFNLFLKSIPLVFALLFVMPEASATHFMGVDITYQCLPNSNNCVFRIFHNTYYDCAGAATTPLPGPPFPPSLQAFQPASCIQPTIVGQWVFVSYTEVTPICATATTQCTNPLATINGVLEARFYADYNFCNTNCNVYNIIWGSCCRNGTITSGSANDGIYSGTTQIDLSQSACNSSPFFTSPPIPYICAGSGAIFDQGAFDPDGDSLAFVLTPCQDNASAQVGYNAGFSPTSPLGSSWQVTIDSRTGELVIAPNPGNVLTGVICVTVYEYRNGVQIGSITRDMQVTVVLCPGSNQAPQIDSITLVSGGTQIGPNHYQLCGSDTLVLAVDGSDADTAQVLGVGTSSSIPGLLISSGASNPVTGMLRITAAQTGTYYIPVLVGDNHCPIPARAFEWVQVDILTICLSAVVTGSPCGQTVGAIDLSVNGAGGPFSYLWSTGDTTEDISGLAPGSYTVTVTDSTGITHTETYTVNSTTISLGASITQPTCANPNAGGVTTAVSGGVSPYTYLWNTGATTASISNIPAGGYSVTVTDANGCPRHAAFIVDPPDSCFNVVEGVIYDDANGNCIMDAGESPMPNMIVDFSPGGAVMTDLNGEYSYRVNTGTYTMQVYPGRWQTLVCPLSGIHTVSFSNVGNVQSNQDFAIHVAYVQEIAVYSTPARVRPGRMSRHYVSVVNNGNVTVSGTLNWEHDSLFSWVGSTPVPNSYSATSHTATWNYFNLGAFQQRNYWIDMTNDSTTPLGTAYTNTATALPIIGDSIPINNTWSQMDSVRASYDPNDKQVSPRGIGPLGLIEQHEKQMNYTVRFQNTGTDTAFYVVIRDTIDTQVLDIFSIKPRMASHPYQLTIENDEILVFRFNNINLPDSSTNLAGSQGFISFEMLHKGTLAIGTQIRNTAAIYFDFNDPVITNTVLNTVFAYPTIDLGADTTLCDGQPIQASISSPGLPPYDFNWSDGTTDPNNAGGITQTAVNGSGMYQVTVTDALGVTANARVAVIANPLPDADFNYNAAGLTVAFTNSSSVNTTWFWDFGDGNTAMGNLTQVHTYAALDKYTITLIVTNDCGRDTLTQDIDLRNVAIDDAGFAQSVSLVPHPVQDVSYLRFANVERASFRLRILDLQGRVVKELGETRADIFEISRGDLAAGIYMYELTGNHSFFGKMVVK